MMRWRTAPTAAPALLPRRGQGADLKTPPGPPPPGKPRLARPTPTPNELLPPPPYAAPQRVDELVKKSEPRQADPFDLPPPSGGAAPALPAGSDPFAVTNDTGPATPK